jgi:site-specific DNA recombinase
VKLRPLPRALRARMVKPRKVKHRGRMPDLRARQSNLRGQLDALDAQLADRDAYLKLADDLEGFLAQLRSNADLASISNRQRVLRLLVKDVLIGPEKITIRHRIPVRERTANRDRQDTDHTDDDRHPSCPLRWGRDRRPLRGAAVSFAARCRRAAAAALGAAA